jgi:uncharacterized membrane protein
LAAARASRILANYHLPLNAALGIQEFQLSYTDWLKGNYPELDSTSSVETYSHIKQAKKETKLWREFFGILIMISLILPINILLSSQGFEPFESAFYWSIFVIVFLLSSFITHKLERKIIKNKLHRIIKAKYA